MRRDGADRFPHGIAFDKDWRVVFTEQELNEFFNPNDAFNVGELQEYCRRRFDCDFPNIFGTDKVEIFDTTKIFFQEGMSEPVTNDPPLRVGVLKRVNNLGQYTTTNLMACMAKNFNIELYFFTPQDFNPKDNTVRAIFIDGNTKIERTLPLPEIVYDDGSYFYKKEVKDLFKGKCYFFQYGWGASKRKIFEILSSDERFKEFLIESHDVKNFKHFLSLFERYGNDVVLKPNVGSLGKDVVRIFIDRGKYVVLRQEEEIHLNSIAKLQNYYEKNFTQGERILQPYIISRTKYGNPFDVRIHARRGTNGEFKLILYPRFGRDPESIISNIAAGGYTMPIMDFFKYEYGEADGRFLRDRLMYLGKNIPELVQSFFGKKIFAMGIDVGIQRRGDSYDLKIFEVNTYNPDTSPIQIEAAFVTLEYLQYLGENLSTLKKP